jgi:two-component system NtrC family sensor kinase
VLVRLFKTHAFGDLDEGLRQSAMKMLGEVSASPSMKCLTLLATAGERLEWNSRAASVGHKAIPLPSERAVENIPMIARLFSQLGVNPGVLLQPDPAFMLKTDQSNFNVFHVPEAQGSPYVPAQKEFVIPCGVKSVLGYGGLLPNGDIFAVILFVKVHVPQETAELFKTLALSTKLILIPFSKDKVFAA